MGSWIGKVILREITGESPSRHVQQEARNQDGKSQPGLTNSRQQAPDRSHNGGDQERNEDHKRARSVKIDRDYRSGETPENKLPLTAKVDDASAKGNRNRQRHGNDRNTSIDHRSQPCASRGAAPQLAVGANRVLPRKEDDHRADQE